MNTHLQMTTINAELHFASPVRIDTYPSFVIRAVLGYQLKRMHCVSHDTLCHECVFHKTCAYAFLFETIIDKFTPVLPGRDRASHPFRIICHDELNVTTSSMSVQVQLFGRACDYVPHVVFALKEAGKGGLFRSRTPYEVEFKNKQDQYLTENQKLLSHRVILENVSLPTGTDQKKKHVKISCKTPLRFKNENKYNHELSISAFVAACIRRIQTMFYLYGTEFANNNAGTELLDNYKDDDCSAMALVQQNLTWQDYQRFSRRQNTVMLLGGYFGTFELSGTAPEYIWNTIELASHIGTGKNTSFGFGDIAIEEVR